MNGTKWTRMQHAITDCSLLAANSTTQASDRLTLYSTIRQRAPLFDTGMSYMTCFVATLFGTAAVDMVVVLMDESPSTRTAEATKTTLTIASMRDLYEKKQRDGCAIVDPLRDEGCAFAVCVVVRVLLRCDNHSSVHHESFQDRVRLTSVSSRRKSKDEQRLLHCERQHGSILSIHVSLSFDISVSILHLDCQLQS